MNAQELIQYIANAPKKTPVKLYVKEKAPIDYGDAKVFGAGDKVVFGDGNALRPILEQNRDRIEDIVIENDRRNSAVPLLDTRALKARIEPGANAGIYQKSFEQYQKLNKLLMPTFGGKS